MSSVLTIKNLSVNFNVDGQSVEALKQINIDIPKGKTVAIVGESGSGKSVTAMSILQLLPTSITQYVSGQILFTNAQQQIDILQTNVAGLRTIRGNQIGMIFQEPMSSLNPLMTCGKQVAESIQLHQGQTNNNARDAVIKLFTEVRLPNPENIYNRFPHELSGGQKQRVMIAMAIACKPCLLIADEPTTALDVTVQHEIITLLQDIQHAYGMSVLFITHDLHLVKSFADEVVVMYQGKIIEQQNTKSIFANPQHPYTRALIDCRPNNNARVNKLATVNDFLSQHETAEIISAKDFNLTTEQIYRQPEILTLEDLHVWYPTSKNFWGQATTFYKAVQGVDLQIRSNETKGLVGESGCGKTSIGKAIVGLAPVHAGNILYKGKYVADFNKADKATYQRNVQIIFQDPYSALNPRICIGKAIEEGMHVHDILRNNERKDKVLELLEQVGLSASFYNRFPHEFSGGQRQRITIARTLALQPEVIICDESVSALDVSIQAQVLNLLNDLQQAYNLTYLFISHDLQVVKHFSHFVAVMQHGKIVEEQQSDSLFAHPQAAYTKSLLAASVA